MHWRPVNVTNGKTLLSASKVNLRKKLENEQKVEHKRQKRRGAEGREGEGREGRKGKEMKKEGRGIEKRGITMSVGSCGARDEIPQGNIGSNNTISNNYIIKVKTGDECRSTEVKRSIFYQSKNKPQK